MAVHNKGGNNMRIIKIAKQTNGAHAYQTIDHLSKLPLGWAVIPTVSKYEKTEDGWKVTSQEMELPNLPYGDVIVDSVCGVPTVKRWIPGEVPEGYGVTYEPEPTAQDDTDTMIIDHEYRITLLELGV